MANLKQRFMKGEVIILEGSHGDQTYKILSGEVLICKQNRGGDMSPIAKLTPGEMFGEMYLLEQSGLRSATALAATDVVLEVFFQDEMVRMLQPLNSSQKMMLSGLSGRLKDTSEDYVSSYFPTAGATAPVPVEEYQPSKNRIHEVND